MGRCRYGPAVTTASVAFYLYFQFPLIVSAMSCMDACRRLERLSGHELLQLAQRSGHASSAADHVLIAAKLRRIACSKRGWHLHVCSGGGDHRVCCMHLCEVAVTTAFVS